MTGVKKEDQRFQKEIRYVKKAIPYQTILEEVKKSNCLLEVTREFQDGPTLRYFEAVCYNKKLLTNSKYIVNLPFYNPKYMKVFEKPEDIDWNWVRERIPVDYGYDGRFPRRIYSMRFLI